MEERGEVRNVRAVKEYGCLSGGKGSEGGRKEEIPGKGGNQKGRKGAMDRNALIKGGEGGNRKERVE